ncbi:MAG: phosphoenolpyruvate synthase [Dehalococcoidia bacterium]|nr:phosphoenolpyruvate synthase [Dehalococcoidia bacterium]
MSPTIRWFSEVAKEDVGSVGGKGASLGEMTRAQIPVPPGFVVTAEVYSSFFRVNGLSEPIQGLLTWLDSNNSAMLNDRSEKIKRLVLAAPIPAEVATEICHAYHKLGAGLVAVRSSATAEDLPEASFAGQQSTYLNVIGDDEVVNAVRECWASLFEPRAIFYRTEQGFNHADVTMAVVIQRMVQSERSGVMFTVEPVSNDGSKLTIEAVYGLGEAVVSGAVTPDFYLVEKSRLTVVEKRIARQDWKLVRNPERRDRLQDANRRMDIPHEDQGAQKLTDKQIIDLTRLGLHIERHYGVPQDIEWAYADGGFYIVQSRPITTLNTAPGEIRKIDARVLLKGSAASPGIVSGQVSVVRDLRELDKVKRGDILVTEMTTPDFVPAMKRAAGIVTDKGGRTCHAAIVSRELGIPCVVGAETATATLKPEVWVTVDGSAGVVYEGKVEITSEVSAVSDGPVVRTATRVYVNLADPERAESVSKRHVDGVGLLRAEFIIANTIKEHPRYMMDHGRGQEWSDKLSRGIEAFASVFHPRPVVYRTTDFKTNEYRNLRGGERYEAHEENPMIGYRGAARYLKEPDLFKLEAEAIRKVWERYPSLCVMIPFIRSPKELAEVKALLESHGLSRDRGMKLWMMCEVPTNVILLDQFLDVGIDGVSIGSNDLTQLTLGIDRDNERFATAFDERDAAVMWCLEKVVKTCVARGVTSSICGQAPSDYPELTAKLVEWGITSVSISPDMIDKTRESIAGLETRLGRLPKQEQA